jgi:hypothetical protein
VFILSDATSNIHKSRVACTLVENCVVNTNSFRGSVIFRLHQKPPYIVTQRRRLAFQNEARCLLAALDRIWPAVEGKGKDWPGEERFQ